MIEVSVKDSKTFKYILESISEIVDEASFTFFDDSFRIEGADPSIISKIDVFLEKDFFSTFIVEDPVEFGVDMTSLDKVAKRILSGDMVTLLSHNRENMLEVILNGGFERRFDAPLIELNNNLPKIDLDFPAVLEMESEVFRNCIKDLAVAGGSVKFFVSPEELVLSSNGELGNVVVTIDSENDAMFGCEVSRPCEARYNLSYLMSFLKAGQISDTIKLSFGDRDFPLKLEFTLESGYMVFFLAPMEY